ncbi:sensor histidine kinase [Cellulomonas taurus]|uniref:sensor histidine kinase n=1 Tax=Cellulomonas taurus TaxID=2729175 RepID=UPI001FEC129B|nr:ATP-binding protein [Cellulomonas taurus]
MTGTPRRDRERPIAAATSLPRLPDVRPLDRFKSLKIKLGVLVAASSGVAALLTWFGLNNTLGPTRTFPVVLVIVLVFTQLLARGMTSPLREMTSAVRSMAAGDYTRRVRATSRDEVGQLAEAFNRMADELEQTDTIRRELVANVSHELRTPVTALQASLENIVDGVDDPDPETMKAALAQTQRLSRLVSTLLDLSRLEAGAVELNLTDVPLREFLEEAASEGRLVGASKALTFPVVVEPENLVIPADRERLHQILANLVQNAVRHSPVGAEIRLEAHRSGGWVRLDVVDQGPGIQPDQRERVFERFARGNTPAITGQISTGGTGLGLSIVRWAVNLHGGTVGVADTPVGCTMRVMLPSRRQSRRSGGSPATSG